MTNEYRITFSLHCVGVARRKVGQDLGAIQSLPPEGVVLQQSTHVVQSCSGSIPAQASPSCCSCYQGGSVPALMSHPHLATRMCGAEILQDLHQSDLVILVSQIGYHIYNMPGK